MRTRKRGVSGASEMRIEEEREGTAPVKNIQRQLCWPVLRSR